MRALLLALVLSPPVPAPVEERFSYAEPFVRGAHRGVDFAAAPGAVVRSVCDGTVAHAGPVAGEEVVSLRCGAHRVSLVGVRASVRRGARVRAGARVGRATGEIHLGVRRENDRLAYLDPERFLPAERHGAPPAGPGAPFARLPGHESRKHRDSRGELDFRAPAPAEAPAEPAARPGLPLAPWPAWLGLALALAGAVRTLERPPIASVRRWPSTSRRRSTT